MRRSVILITHRISAAKRCDRVLVIDQGRIVEHGTPSQLEAANGLYASFAEEQRIETELAGLGVAPSIGVAQALSAEE